MPTPSQGPAQGHAFYRSTRSLPHQRMQAMEVPPGCGADDTEYIGAPPVVYGNAAAAGAQPQAASADVNTGTFATMEQQLLPYRQA